MFSPLHHIRLPDERQRYGDRQIGDENRGIHWSRRNQNGRILGDLPKIVQFWTTVGRRCASDDVLDTGRRRTKGQDDASPNQEEFVEEEVRWSFGWVIMYL